MEVKEFQLHAVLDGRFDAKRIPPPDGRDVAKALRNRTRGSDLSFGVPYLLFFFWGGGFNNSLGGTFLLLGVGDSTGFRSVK